jgi:hypothetical protein
LLLVGARLQNDASLRDDDASQKSRLESDARGSPLGINRGPHVWIPHQAICGHTHAPLAEFAKIVDGSEQALSVTSMRLYLPPVLTPDL